MNLKAFARALLVIVAVAVAVGVILFYSVARRGLSTRAEPSRVEEFLARAARRLATPSAVRSMSNPATNAASTWTKRWSTSPTTARAVTPTTAVAIPPSGAACIRRRPTCA